MKSTLAAKVSGSGSCRRRGEDRQRSRFHCLWPRRPIIWHRKRTGMRRVSPFRLLLVLLRSTRKITGTHSPFKGIVLLITSPSQSDRSHLELQGRSQGGGGGSPPLQWTSKYSLDVNYVCSLRQQQFLGL